MAKKWNLAHAATAISLLALSTACGGGATTNNQTAPPTMQAPAGNAGNETMPAVIPPAAPATATNANASDSIVPPVREPEPRLKAVPVQRPAQRNTAMPRPAPTPAPSPDSAPTCTPEHREMGHC